MATTIDRKSVTAKVDALCRPFLRFVSALWSGCLIVSAVALLAGPIAAYLLGEEGFWKSLRSGFGFAIGVAFGTAVLTAALDNFLTSRIVAKFNRRFPLGRERDAAIAVLQEHRWETDGVGAVSMADLLAKLNVPVTAGPAEIAGPPVEAQVTEALETLAAERQEAAPAERAETAPVAASPAAAANRKEPLRRPRRSGVIPLEPEETEPPATGDAGGRPGGAAGQGAAR